MWDFNRQFLIHHGWGIEYCLVTRQNICQKLVFILNVPNGVILQEKKQKIQCFSPTQGNPITTMHDCIVTDQSGLSICDARQIHTYICAKNAVETKHRSTNISNLISCYVDTATMLYTLFAINSFTLHSSVLCQLPLINCY